MQNRHQVFLKGFRKTLPFQTGVLPFGLLYATLAVNAGFPGWLVLLFSMIVFAGSSQLVFVDLLSHIGSPLQAVLGSNFINMRHLIYSAGVSPEFAGFSRAWKILLSYLLTDQLYAFSESFKDETIPLPLRPWYYLGSGLTTWIFWMVSSAAGIYFGQLVPKSWNLDFAIPLMFMPLLFKVCKNKFAYYTAAFSIFFIILFQKIPYGLGIFSSIICASVAGYFFEKRSSR